MTLAHLCLGTASWATDQPYNDRVPPTDDEVKRILDVAEVRGIRWLDTAADYGNVESRLMAEKVWRRFKVTTKIKPAWSEGRVSLFRWDAEWTLLHYGPDDGEIAWSEPGYGASVYTVAQATSALDFGARALQVPWNVTTVLANAAPLAAEWLRVRDRAYADGVLFFGRQPFARWTLSNPRDAFEWALRTNPRGWCVVGVESAAQVEELSHWRDEIS